MTGSRRKSWLITLPLLGLIAVSVLWVAYWYAAREVAKRQVATLPQRGLELSCSQATWAGFPFRFSYICDQAAFKFTRGSSKIEGTAARLSASALAYRPQHMVMEFAPPFQIDVSLPPAPETTFADSFTISGDTAHLRAGVKVGVASVEEFSVKTQSWAGRIRASKSGKLLEDASVELGSMLAHWSPSQVTVPGQNVSVALRDLIYSGRLGTTMGLNNVRLESGDLAATVTHWPAAAHSDLRAWQARGGMLEIKRLAAKIDGRETDAVGTVKLDDKGRLNGRLDAAVNDMAGIFRDLVAAGALKSDEAALASTAIGLLSQQTDENRPGWTVMPIILSKGRVYIGPFKFTRLKPLF